MADQQHKCTVPQHTYGGGGEDIHDLGSRWGRVVSVTPRPHSPPPPLGKGPLVPTGQEAGWAPEPFSTQRLEDKFFASVGNRTSIVWSSST
jgi:hypothetical protein